MKKNNTYQNHFDKAKFIVTRNLTVLLTALLLTLGMANLLMNDSNWIPITAGGLAAGLVWLTVVLTKNHKTGAYIAAVLMTLLNSYNMLVTSEFGHFIDFFWLTTICVFVFFTLGSLFGTINLFVNVYLVVAIYLLERFDLITPMPKDITSFGEVNFVINITVAAGIFSYLFFLMLREQKRAEIKYIQANTELHDINEEKTVMMKEIHHRVKNNLQVVMSLLRLQANEVDDLLAKKHFEDSVNRISAMALIHEKMYQSESLVKIDLKAYLYKLIDDLIRSYSSKTEVEVEIKSEIEHIEPKSIVPVALIFNELVSNTLKHAFGDKNHGCISIQLKRDAGKITVVYHDNGTWKSGRSENGFGLEMIEIFTEQLDGLVKRTTDSGTTYHFEFPARL